MNNSNTADKVSVWQTKQNNNCFSGETSAGKSSLLNLLLGTDVLPHSLLCATATICRLHNSKDKRVEIESYDGDIKTISLDEADQTSGALHKKLKPYISSKEMRIKNPYKNVDIYWPLPLLQVAIQVIIDIIDATILSYRGMDIY